MSCIQKKIPVRTQYRVPRTTIVFIKFPDCSVTCIVVFFFFSLSFSKQRLAIHFLLQEYSSKNNSDTWFQLLFSNCPELFPSWTGNSRDFGTLSGVKGEYRHKFVTTKVTVSSLVSVKCIAFGVPRQRRDFRNWVVLIST